MTKESRRQEHTSSFNGKHKRDLTMKTETGEIEVSHLAKVLVVLEHGFAFRKIVIEFLNAFFVLAHKSLRQNQFDKATFHASEFHFCFNFRPRKNCISNGSFLFLARFFMISQFIFLSPRKSSFYVQQTRECMRFHIVKNTHRKAKNARVSFETFSTWKFSPWRLSDFYVVFWGIFCSGSWFEGVHKLRHALQDFNDAGGGW